jgi:hypothetical protein
MRLASRNAGQAGLGMTGYIALCEAIDRMPARPDWTEHFMPRDIRASKLRHVLRILEAYSFAGQGIDLD